MSGGMYHTEVLSKICYNVCRGVGTGKHTTMVVHKCMYICNPDSNGLALVEMQQVKFVFSKMNTHTYMQLQVPCDGKVNFPTVDTTSTVVESGTVILWIKLRLIGSETKPLHY